MILTQSNLLLVFVVSNYYKANFVEDQNRTQLKFKVIFTGILKLNESSKTTKFIAKVKA